MTTPGESETDDFKGRISLARKLSRLSEDVRYLRKDKKHGMGFGFVSSTEVFAKLNEALRSNGLAVFSTGVDVVSEGRVATVRVRLTIACLDTGATTVFSGAASGHDPGDKGVSKAVTMAAKYAWLTGLVIATGDDEPSVFLSRETLANLAPRLRRTTDLDTAASLFVQFEDDLAAAGDVKVVNQAKGVLVKHCASLGASMDEITSAITRARASLQGETHES